MSYVLTEHYPELKKDLEKAIDVATKIVKRNNMRVADDLDHIHIPDPVAQKISELENRIEELENK